MMSRRFRNTSDLFRSTRSEVGTLGVDDCHSILVSLSKLVKQHRLMHPVRVAPLAADLVSRIIRSDADSRTKAGTFGLVSRLGIDWRSHSPEGGEFLENLTADFKTFMASAERIPPTSLGYCCEFAGFVGIHSPEFSEKVRKEFLECSRAYPVLATVQVAKYLAGYDSEHMVLFWDSLGEHALIVSRDMTPQNAVDMLEILVSAPVRNKAQLVSKLSQQISPHSSYLRPHDCWRIAFAFQRLESELDVDDTRIQRLSRTLLRRMLLLTATGANPTIHWRGFEQILAPARAVSLDHVIHPKHIDGGPERNFIS
jgi:hypothetical protein